MCLRAADNSNSRFYKNMHRQGLLHVNPHDRAGQCTIVCCCSVVEFANREDMKAAIRKLDGTELNGRRLRLTEERVSSSHHRR